MKKWFFRILFLLAAVGVIFCFMGFDVTCDGEFQGVNCSFDGCGSSCAACAILESCNQCNHSYKKIEETESTCAEAGYTKYECRKCGDIDTQYKRKPDHVITHTFHRGDCSSEGDHGWYEQDACSNCDYVYITHTYYKGSGLHYFDEGEIAYYEDGSGCGEITYTCLICGETKTSRFHSEESVKMQEYMQKLTERQCSIFIGDCDLCGKFINLTWHNIYTETIVLSPTETEYGLKEYRCTQTNSGSDKHCTIEDWLWYEILLPVTEQTDF